MTTYTFPSITPNETQIELLSNTKSYVSPITGATQTSDRGGERWQVTMNFRDLRNADRAVMMAFVSKLNGQQHRISLPNHAANNRGSFGGTPLVDGASQTGTTIDVDGCTPSVTNWIREGDWFSFGDGWKICTADTDSDGSGDITIPFASRIRTAPANNTAIVTSNPVGVFLLNEGATAWTNKPGGFSDFVITVIEDIAA